jgi:hypothetical protein
MKTHFLKLMAFVLILIPILSSCEKELVCGVKNPVKELSWLKEIIDNNSHDTKIYQCTYKYGTGFLVDPCASCMDAGFTFFNCDGVIVCEGNGMTGQNNCAELNISEKRKLIYH